MAIEDAVDHAHAMGLRDGVGDGRDDRGRRRAVVADVCQGAHALDDHVGGGAFQRGAHHSADPGRGDVEEEIDAALELETSLAAQPPEADDLHLVFVGVATQIAKPFGAVAHGAQDFEVIQCRELGHGVYGIIRPRAFRGSSFSVEAQATAISEDPPT